MYKMNIFLKLILTFLTLLVLLFTNSYIILWLLLLVITFLNYRKSNNILIYDILLVVLLAVVSRVNYLTVLYKILFFMNIIITLFYYLSLKEKKCLYSLYKGDKTNSKEKFYELVFNDTFENNKKIVNNKYGDINFDEKIQYDLDRKYLQSKIRFNGYYRKSNNLKIVWNKIDTMILLFSILIFIIMIILSR